MCRPKEKVPHQVDGPGLCVSDAVNGGDDSFFFPRHGWAGRHRGGQRGSAGVGRSCCEVWSDVRGVDKLA